MKGKVFRFKVVLTMLLVLTAGFCFVLSGNSTAKAERIYAASTRVTINEEEYSSLLQGDVIFSVEKVAVNSAEDAAGYPQPLVDAKTFLGVDNAGVDRVYTFANIANGDKNKTVVDNGTFVKLDNVKTGNQYSKPEVSGLQEAIMVSFGAYVYDDENKVVNIARNDTDTTDDVDDTISAKISYLEMVLEKDGKIVSNIPKNRNIKLVNGGLYFDFTYLITQQDDNSNEGYYKFSFKYMADGLQYQNQFEFYLINNTSYTLSKDTAKGYNAKPTLGWTEGSQFVKDPDDTGFVRYYIGKNGLETDVAYPTITYDYTKYELHYTHTANQRNTTYAFKCVTSKNATGDISAKMVCTITTNGKSSVKEYDLEYDQQSTIHLVTIMLTEPGTYVADYQFLYGGYNSNLAPELGFKTQTLKLAIHGMSTYYSKTDFEGAKLQCFNIAADSSNGVSLIVPNGYEMNENVSSLKTQKLGFVYNLVQSVAREGNILRENTLDSLINDQLKENKADYEGKPNAYDFLVRTNDIATKSLITKDNVDMLNSILENINYVSTNQGSLWISGNDSYTANSFYYYFPTKIDASTIFNITKSADGTEILDVESQNAEIAFDNTTSFKSKGYYLVFLQIIPSGTSNPDETKYWQVFAFQYTSSSVNITIEAINEDQTRDVIAGGKYTNKDVEISWQKPGIFDRSIKAYYYAVGNQNYSKDELLKTVKHTLNYAEKEDKYVAQLGGVAAGTFVKYLIRLESEGESATHKIFTIDRQNISGIQPYLIQEMYSGNSIYYSYATDKNNVIIPINNSITNGYATLSWKDKASGAEIFAKYSYTPFSSSSNASRSITGNSSKEWITTNYELGTTIHGSDLKRSESIYSVSSECILFNQGIYIITLWDSAGNTCNYAFVIDRTENYFNVQDEFLSNAYALYGDNVNYSVGDYKVFKLSSTDTQLSNLIQKAAENKLDTFEQYYVGSNNNVSVFSNLFQRLGNDYYLTVKNERVVAYQNEEVDSSIYATKGELKYSVNGESYYKRTLYVVGANQTFTTKKITDGAYLTVEINKDNARGMVYYSSTEMKTLPNNGSNSNSAIRLDTGSDMFDENDNEIANGLSKAHATSAKHVAFVWNVGTGNFEVATVKYSYYQLKPNSYQNGKYYFYGSPEEIPLYTPGKWSNNAVNLGDGRGMVNFNGSSDSKAGLYVVTRIYKEIVGADLGDDVKEKNYYFIIDRNGIIDTTLGIGGSIKINLMENDEEFQEFSTHNADGLVFSNYEDGVYDARYNVYLSTTKLPATLNIPTGKYFTGTYTSADYYAGKLNISVYFNDIYNQLSGQFKGKTVKIFGTENGYNIVDKCFVVNIYDYLSQENVSLRDRISESSGRGTWLFLSGDYIIRLTDNVENNFGTKHEKYIGLRVVGSSDKGPQIEALTGYKQTDMSKVDTVDNGFKYTATVSQEFLKVVLPAYEDNIVKKAQVDPNYIVVKQTYKSNTLTYINHAYEPLNGINLVEDSDYVTLDKNDDGSLKAINVWLDTKLRDTDGNINLKNLKEPLEYTITIRYKLNNNPADKDRYKNCYIFYDQNGVKKNYYEATYTISIDREAPKVNIENLNKQDSMVGEYNNIFGSDSMIVDGFHETTSNLYFTKQYDKYYQAQADNQDSKGYIYAYLVFADKIGADGKVIKNGTPFDTTDVAKVLYKQISDISSYNLSLPIIDQSSYRSFSVNRQISGYQGLPGLIANSYYEIVELDKAGNATQYVIHYEPSTAEISIPMTVTTTSGTIDTDFELSLLEDLSVNVYDISTNDKDVLKSNENFYKILVQRTNGTQVLKVLTTLTTKYENLPQTIVDALKAEKFGNFNIIIETRTVKKIININLYDQKDVIPLDIERLVVEGDTYYIDLDRANESKEIEGTTLMFFATEITIKSATQEVRFVGRIDENGIIKYYEYNNYLDYVTNPNVKLEEVLVFNCEANTTYYLTMTDVLGTKSTYRFNTSGQTFIELSFDEPGNYYEGNEGTNIVYYGYTDATLKYDKTIYTSKIWKKTNSGSYSISDIMEDTTSDDIYNLITIRKVYDEITGEGGIVSIKIDLYFEEKIERTYYITIDTRLSSVALRDYTTGEKRDIIKITNNAEYTDESIRADKTGSGIMNLHWDTVEDNNYFTYQYILHELMDTDVYRTKDLTGKNNYVISTANDSKGIYKFEIRVYGKDNLFIGNRIFAFEVQEVSTQIYYVRNQETGEAVRANSSFKVDELGNALKNEITTRYANINTKVNLALFITNQTLEVVVTMVNVDITSFVFVENLNYTFTIYKLSKTDSYDIYLGIMRVAESDNIVNDVNIISTKTDAVGKVTSFTVSGLPEMDVKIQASKANQTSDVLLNKNLVLIETYYNKELIGETLFNDAYTIKGNGQYSFVFKDLAGNIHVYENDAEYLDVYVLREVVITLNGVAPVNNSFYNDTVSMIVYASNKYVTGSITVRAYKNGVEYKPVGFNPYEFKGYGNFRVIVEAKYNNGQEELPLRKTVSFTILNVNEARKSIDLTSLSGSKITKVLNPSNQDVTEHFVDMLQNNVANGGMNISYEDIMENSTKLNVTSGKQTFTITYLVEDEIYPPRSITLSFTLNNESPSIQCTLEKGETTKKGFEIFFNPAILYEQVGDSYVYVNDQVVARINAGSTNEEMRIAVSYDKNGDGDYYVRLVSSSGIVLDSYKLVIKEPLNSWAIIVIIVIVGVIGTVVTTIIVLRRKMRIR